jgi:hypothetical protein
MGIVFPSTNLNLPFQAGVKGAVLDTQFRVRTTEGYNFNLDLHFRENNAQDRERVRELAGTGQYNRAGRQINTGLPIPVRLRVSRIGDGVESVVLDGAFTDHDLEGFSASYYAKIITGARLEPGTYRVRIEALQDIPELNDVLVQLDIHTSRRK